MMNLSSLIIWAFTRMRERPTFNINTDARFSMSTAPNQANTRAEAMIARCYSDRNVGATGRSPLQAGRNLANLRLHNAHWLFRGGERSLVIRVLADAADIFDVFELVVGADDENGAREDAIERAAGNQQAVILAERSLPVVAGSFKIKGVRGATPALL